MDRTGEERCNNQGSKMRVIKYNSASDITIKFDNGYTTKGLYSNFKIGNIKNPYDKTVHGVGYIGEGQYKVSEKQKMTIYYQHWQSILQRCYDDKFQNKYPSYKGCIICEEWLNYQTFAKWFDENYYKVENDRMCVDKDILIKNNKLYSPDTCLIVPNRINTLFLKNDANRGKLLIGLDLHVYKDNIRYRAKCGRKSLGIYSTQEEGFYVYKDAKENKIKSIAEEYKNKIPKKVYDALLNYKIDITD